MQVKAIITDLDGTVINSPDDTEVSQIIFTSVQNALKSGIKICAATGRPTTFARPLLIGLGLKDPAIVAGGTRIIDPVSGDELWGMDIPEGSVQEILEVLKTLDYGILWNDYEAPEYLNGGWKLDHLTSTKGLYFLEVCFVPDDEAIRLADKLNHIKGITTIMVVSQRPGKRDLHIINQHATKEHAIYELQKMLGIAKKETVGVGDGHNDFHIFNAVAHKVAMGNAVPDLKEKADVIIGDVKDNGLAKFIDELVKNKGQL